MVIFMATVFLLIQHHDLTFDLQPDVNEILSHLVEGLTLEHAAVCLGYVGYHQTPVCLHL